jgi:hypothetical protein
MNDPAARPQGIKKTEQILMTYMVIPAEAGIQGFL